MSSKPVVAVPVVHGQAIPERPVEITSTGPPRLSSAMGADEEYPTKPAVGGERSDPDHSRPDGDLMVDSAMLQIWTELSAHPRPRELTPEASSELRERGEEYVAELGVQAVLMARRQGLDVVSAVHVKNASDTLLSARPKLFARILGAFGGVVAGAGAAQWLAVLPDQHPSTLAYVVATASLLLGTIMLMASFMVDRP